MRALRIAGTALAIVVLALLEASCQSVSPTAPSTSVEPTSREPTAAASFKPPPSTTRQAYVYAWFFNVRPGHPFSDPALRQAIAMCLDTSRMFDETASLAPDPVIPASGLLSGDATADGPLLPAPRFDPEGARSGLASAGWTIGLDGVAQRADDRLASILGVIPNGPAWRWQPLATAEGDLRACGVDLAHPDDFAGGVPVTTDRAELGLMRWPATPEGLAAALGSAAAIDGALPEVANWSGWSDSETDRLLGEIRSAPSEADRLAALDELEERISDRLPVIPLWLEP